MTDVQPDQSQPGDDQWADQMADGEDFDESMGDAGPFQALGEPPRLFGRDDFVRVPVDQDHGCGVRRDALQG